MIITTIARWYGAVRSCWRALVYGVPEHRLAEPQVTHTPPALEPWPHIHAFSTAPAPLDDGPALPEPRCQGPESTPGSFSYMRSHEMQAVIEERFAGLECALCGLRWPPETRR
jgi:hypothetical protein